MNIQMLVTDLDGTLLHTDKTISEYTASVFRRCRERGMKIVFATARPARNLAQFTQTVQPDAIISDNGARAFINGQAILQRDVSPEAVAQIVETLLPLVGIRLHLNYEHTSFTNHETWRSWGSWGVQYSDFSYYDPCGVQKIAIEAQDISLLSHVDFEALGCHFTGSQGEKWYLVTAKTVAKRNGIEAVAAHFGIPLAGIAAFGDDQIDIEMLRLCGAGVAVANAIDEAKAAANDLCGSNDDDGPAHWIEKNLL